MRLHAGRQGDFGAATEIVVVVVGIVPIDLELVTVEVDVRNAVIGVA